MLYFVAICKGRVTIPATYESIARQIKAIDIQMNIIEN